MSRRCAEIYLCRLIFLGGLMLCFLHYLRLARSYFLPKTGYVSSMINYRVQKIIVA